VKSPSKHITSYFNTVSRYVGKFNSIKISVKLEKYANSMHDCSLVKSIRAERREKPRSGPGLEPLNIGTDLYFLPLELEERQMKRMQKETVIFYFEL
jgi:hypothetical protein